MGHLKCYKCNYCNFEAATVSGIDEHIKANHATENILNCDNCDKTFRSEIRLKIHKNVHQSKRVIRFCHYYNNNKFCPYEYSEFCKYHNKCHKNSVSSGIRVCK